MFAQEISKIDEMLLRSTVKIMTSANSFGTGFIISCPADNNKRFFFLVTNKHLVGEYSLADGVINNYYEYLVAFLYKKDGTVQKIKIPLKDKEGKLNANRVFLHPQPYIDIVILPIADAFAAVEGIDIVSLDISLLATSNILKNWHVDIGDQIFALGYPFDIYSQSNNYPIAKSGYISSKIGEELIITVNYKDKNGNSIPKQLKGKIILIDGIFVPGNSGGPIFVPRGRREFTERETNKIMQANESIPNFIIGIQSQSLTPAGISFAFSSEYITELINDIISKIKIKNPS